MRVPEAALREWCRRARKLWPLDRPVRVRRWCLSKKTIDDWGVAYSYGTEDSYVIVLDKRLDWDAAVDALIHEWCHLRRHDDTEETGHLHDDEFWLEYGSMHRAWYNEK